ncbi:hypothetical protein [Prochlorococcus sp. MIT 1300]|uniref:hypothetical protein n=1 Tax=Prochlorococcus sp. MIT 1300 TaxID=3096218 RepID=UPI002A75093C|nr:hypothetical protein [Prochlorococcus sp. MIT 1300]
MKNYQRLINIFCTGLLLAIAGCDFNEIRSNRDNKNSCLEKLNIESIGSSIALCDELIKKYPANIFLINDRVLLHILNNNKEKACEDVLAATKLIKSQDNFNDPILKAEFRIRQASCTQLSNIFAND